MRKCNSKVLDDWLCYFSGCTRSLEDNGEKGCWGALHSALSRLAKLTMLETYENSVRIDLAFITLIWVAFFPTISTPVLFLSWRMNR
ncbi:hypothetical protein M8J75_009888 [Diaphorina citri]|nr:hypothetical protein M8J75_009888 [Diaphorina citri]